MSVFAKNGMVFCHLLDNSLAVIAVITDLSVYHPPMTYKCNELRRLLFLKPGIECLVDRIDSGTFIFRSNPPTPFVVTQEILLGMAILMRARFG